MTLFSLLNTPFCVGVALLAAGYPRPNAAALVAGIIFVICGVLMASGVRV